MLLSGRLCAGVYSGLDSDSGFKNPVTHPPNGVVGFLFAGDQSASRSPMTFQCAPVAKWQTRGSAKPVFAGSIPARRSKFSSRGQTPGEIAHVESYNRLQGFSTRCLCGRARIGLSPARSLQSHSTNQVVNPRHEEFRFGARRIVSQVRSKFPE